MIRRILLLLIAVLACGIPGVAGENEAGQWIVVTAPEFRDALKPLIEHRRKEGFRVIVVESTDILSPQQIGQGNAIPLKEHLNKLCKQADGPSYILLVGCSKSIGS